jgi:hypothetical protein
MALIDLHCKTEALRDNLITQPPHRVWIGSIRVADANPETGHLFACLGRGRRPCFTRFDEVILFAMRAEGTSFSQPLDWACFGVPRAPRCLTLGGASCPPVKGLDTKVSLV